MLESLNLARTLVLAVEVERQCIEELELLVVLHQMAILDPGGRGRILGKLGLQTVLPFQFGVARQRVEISGTARITGSLAGNSIAVAEGAVIEGDIKVTDGEQPVKFEERRQNRDR